VGAQLRREIGSCSRDGGTRLRQRADDINTALARLDELIVAADARQT
jgi:hypothetical protein